MRKPPSQSDLEEAVSHGIITEAKLEEFTCHKCSLKDTCRSAWDYYNTNGDCLEDK